MKFIKHKFTPFAVYLVATWLLYFQTIDAGFVTDWTGWQARYEVEGWGGVLNCYGEPILHQVLHFFSYLIFYLFGTTPLPWLLCFTILHALNAAIFHRITFRLLQKFEIKNHEIIPWLAALLFLLSPYQSEVIVWKVCLHYLMVVLFGMLAINHFLSFLEEKKVKDLIAIHFYSILGLFTIELGLMIPFLTISVLLLLYLRSEIILKPILLKIILPQFIFLFTYFGLNRLIFKDWVGHYGSAAHLNFDLNIWLGGLARYFVKHLGYVHYFTPMQKQVIYEFLVNGGIYWIYGIFFILITVFFIRIKKMSNQNLLIYWSLAAFVLVILPIVNLHFVYVHHVENDRYGYWGAMFLAFFVVLILFHLPKWLAYSLVFIYMIIGIQLTYQTNNYWRESAFVQNALMNDFRWYDKSEVIVLASPENFEGAMLFRIIGEESELVYCLEYLRKVPYKGRLIEAAQFNMKDRMDGVRVEWLDPQTIHVSFNQDGNWFWRNSIGASNYENDLYSIDFQNGRDYYMKLKGSENNRVFIYPENGKWKESRWEE